MEKGKENGGTLALERAPDAGCYCSFIVRNPWLSYGLAWVCMILFVIIGLAIAFLSKEIKLAGAGVGFSNRGSDLAGRILAYNHIKRLECEGSLMLTADGSRSKFYRWDVEDDSDDPSELTADMCYDGYTTEDNNRWRLMNSVPRRGHRLNSNTPWDGMPYYLSESLSHPSFIFLFLYQTRY